MVAFLLPPFRKIFAICLLALVMSGAASARSRIAAVTTEPGVAVKGYDPVSYFTDRKPVRGSAQFSTSYKGVEYRFVSAEHRDRFLAEPEKFVPQYGGYCAFPIALNTIADIDPDEWAIVNDKLYLNNSFFSQKPWSLDNPPTLLPPTPTSPLLPN